MTKQILITTVLLLTGLIFCQENITENVVAGLTAIERSCAAWADYDNDGDQDILITGSKNGAYADQAITKLYRNDGGDNFTDVAHGLPQTYGRFDWGDYDNDGFIDIAITGLTPDDGSLTRIYRNNGDGNFILTADLGDFNDGSQTPPSTLAWGDYDNDGDLDLLVTGDRIAGTKYDPITKLFRNDSGIFADTGIELPAISNSTVVWGDYNNDECLDLLITGEVNSVPVTKILKNEAGAYFNDIEAGLIGVSGLTQSAAWEDYDNDGDLDVFLAGRKDIIGWGIAVLYRNDTNDNFVHTATFTGSNYLSGGSISLGDCDGNGYSDFILTGPVDPSWIDFTSLYLNNNGFEFSQNFRSMRMGSVAWSDYDNDGDLDFWLNGYDGTAPYAGENFSEINRNNKAETTGIVNNSPVKPLGLYSSLIDNNVRIFWNKSTDAETPQNGLSYNIYVGTESKNGDVLNPMSNISDGFRKIARKGNVDHNTAWAIKDLSDGIYYYGAQAVDHGFAGSEFSPECIFVKGEHTLPELYSISLSENAEMRLLLGSKLSFLVGSAFELSENSNLILEDKSTLTLQLTDLVIHQSTTLKLGKNAKLIIENGSNLTIEEGAVIELAEGAEIVVMNKGNLSVNGATFNYVGTTGNWLGINCEGGSSVDINNSIIRNASTGVYGTGTYKFNITNTVFEGCTNGINLLGMQPGFGYTITDNTLTGTDNGWGIFITGSDGLFSRNIVNHFNIGTYFVMSSPVVSKCDITYNKYFGIVVSGHDALPQLLNTEDNQPFGAVNCTIQKNAYLGNSSLFPSAQIGINPTGSIYMRYNDIISSPNFYGISIAQEDLRDPDQLITIDAQLNNWGSNIVTDDYFFEHPQYIIDYTPIWTLADEEESNSYNSDISEESRILINAIELEAKDKLTPAIKLYEHIIKKYVDTPEYYVAMARLPYLYEQAELDNNVLIALYDEALNSDATSHKKFFKGKKVATHIKGKRYDEAISLAEEMKAEAAFEEEVLLADINIAIANLLKDMEGKSRSGVDYAQNLRDLQSKLTDNESKAEPSGITESVLPTVSTLYQNYPNPFNPVTQIKFDLAKSAKVRLSVYNVNGQVVAELASGVMNAGNHAVDFDGSKLNSGVYYYTLEADGIALTKKMVLTK
ncbi:TPA: hypothetical protein DCR49_12485 [Candidatus Delongbacteria bacterium]|nr:hypothetical protein [Candidatus Delongbacteria bacterium]